MPQLVFDPDGELDICSLSRRKPLRGGGLLPETRCEYIRLIKLLTSRDPSLNYTELRDAILAIMREDVLAYIHTLPESDRAPLLAAIDQFYSTLDTADNPFTCINVIGVQIGILFTDYIVHYEEGYNIKNNSTYPEFEIYETSIKTDAWKTYSGMKEILGNNTEESYNVLVENTIPENASSSSRPIYILFIGFVTLGELMESFLNNIVYCSLNYKREYIDGGIATPIVAIHHDIGHYLTYFNKCKQSSSYLTTIKQFHSYALTKYDRPTLYAIHFVLFFFLHEEYCRHFNLENNSQSHHSKEFIYTPLKQYIFVFNDLTWLGLCIPKAYRIVQKDGRLNDEKIDEYLHHVSELYATCYKEFLASRTAGGRRKRQTRKKRIGHKKSRRSSRH
jgi:hypothetical protein